MDPKPNSFINRNLNWISDPKPRLEIQFFTVQNILIIIQSDTCLHPIYFNMHKRMEGALSSWMSYLKET